MNNARNIGLDTCKEKFPSLSSVSQLEMSEGITVELCNDNEDAYFYQIKWKLEPCPKHFAKVINYCRLACTEDGTIVIQLHLRIKIILSILFRY